MPRLMTFQHTIPQIRGQTKTVTRRIGWWFLQPGDLVQPVEKSPRALKDGEEVVYIGKPIMVLQARAEPLNMITREDVVKEGFPRMSPGQFIDMFCGFNHCDPGVKVNRVEFAYTEPLYNPNMDPQVLQALVGDLLLCLADLVKFHASSDGMVVKSNGDPDTRAIEHLVNAGVLISAGGGGGEYEFTKSYKAICNLGRGDYSIDVAEGA
jgi:hypothetical protein